MDLWTFSTRNARDQLVAQVDAALGAGQCENPSCGGSARRFVNGQEVPIPPCPNAPEGPHDLLNPGGYCPPWDHPSGEQYGAFVDSTALEHAQATGIAPAEILSFEQAFTAGWFG